MEFYGTLSTFRIPHYCKSSFPLTLPFPSVSSAFKKRVLTRRQLHTLCVWQSQFAEKCLLEGNKFWFYSLLCSIILGGLQLWDSSLDEEFEKEKERGMIVEVDKELPPLPLSAKKRRNAAGKDGGSDFDPTSTTKKKIRTTTLPVQTITLTFSSSDEKRRKAPKSSPNRKAIEAEINEKIERRLIRRGVVADLFDLFVPGNVTGWIRTGPTVVGCATVVSTLLGLKGIWEKM